MVPPNVHCRWLLEHNARPWMSGSESEILLGQKMTEAARRAAASVFILQAPEEGLEPPTR